MATNQSISNGTDRQPREFEIRRAELVGQIGDVSAYNIVVSTFTFLPCQPRTRLFR